MAQDQLTVPVLFQDGGHNVASATGNNASWHCRCSRELPLIGCSGLLDREAEGYRVDCPGCTRSYQVIPDGADRGRVAEVHEVQRP